MSQLRITLRASSDLIEIWSYIADDSEANADGFIGRVYETMELLARQPGLGRRRDELAPGIQSFSAGHECVTVQQLGWAGKKNGELLDLAEPLFELRKQTCQALSVSVEALARPHLLPFGHRRRWAYHLGRKSQALAEGGSLSGVIPQASRVP